MSRPVEYRYCDPLDLVWIETARRCGITVTRDPAVNASWDGQGQLRIGTADLLDSDDCLAQLILHEICHALVAGPAGMQRPDWGLDYDNPRHRVFEHAALRVQAALADRHGLGEFLAATTDFREFQEGLPADPLAGRDDPLDGRPAERCLPLARQAWQRAQQPPWNPHLGEALRATRDLVNAVKPFADASSLWSRNQRRPAANQPVIS